MQPVMHMQLRCLKSIFLKQARFLLFFHHLLLHFLFNYFTSLFLSFTFPMNRSLYQLQLVVIILRIITTIEQKY